MVASCAPSIAPQIGYLSPDFTARSLDKTKIQLKEFRGEIVLLNYWSIGCQSCNKEMKEIDNIYHLYKDKNVVIISINPFENETQVQQFLDVAGYGWYFIIDKSQELVHNYQVNCVPMNFIIDTKGRIREIFVGFVSEEKLSLGLSELIE